MKFEYGISIELSPGLWKKGTLTLDGKEGESPEQLMDRTAKAFLDWFDSKVAPAQQAPSIINIREQAALDAENDRQFQQLKETLENIKYREEAQAYLDGTEFKHTIEAKKIVNSKPKKND